MKKQEFINYLFTIVDENKELFKNDVPALDYEFNVLKDSLHKDGVITDNQVQNWILTKKERVKFKKFLQC